MNLKQALEANQPTLGSWITIGHQSIVEIMATAPFDWLTIDLEHSVIDLNTAQQLISHIERHQITPLARVSKNEEVVIKRIMDAGCHGVIVPMVNTKADAEQAVQYVRYPSSGRRGVGLARAQGYGTKFESYLDWLENESVIIVQIEHIDAVNNLEEILNVPGIDGMIVGPYDLSGSMKMPGKFDHPDVQAAIAHIESTAKDRNFPLGTHVIQPDHSLVTEKRDAGYTFIAFSLDFLFLGDKCRTEMEKLQ